MTKIAIVGGGPGGLFAAQLLEEFCADLCDVTLFEGSSRIGGKIVTAQFETAPVTYEAGVAEVYSVAGEADIVAVVRVRHHEELADVVTSRISALPGITNTRTLIAFCAYSRHDHWRRIF